MIERNSNVPDNIVELDSHQNIGDYARRYGDELSQLYEDLNVLYVPYFHLDIDLELFQALQFPAELKKIGTKNRLDENIVKRTGLDYQIDTHHPIVKIASNLKQASYIRNQIASVNAQIKEAVRILFPKYYSLKLTNLTWRFTDTEASDLHLDTFDSGKIVDPALRRHRVKVFINIDTEPRQWATSFVLPEVLKRAAGQLPQPVPADLNHLNHVINQSGAMNDFPTHRVNYPAMSAVFVNAEAVPHQVLFGQRMIAGEFACEIRDMLDPSKCTHASLSRWLREAGLEIDDVQPHES